MMEALPSSINEIDKDISDAQDTLSSLPRSSPRLHTLLSFLAILRFRRYGLSDDERDLETSILQFTLAIFLPFHLSIEAGQKFISTFYILSMALYLRSDKLKQPSDIKYCVQYLYYLRSQSLEGYGINCNRIKSFLVKALALQLELEPGNAMESLDKMSVLCQELLASDISQQDLSVPVTSFSRAVDAYISDSLTQLVLPGSASHGPVYVISGFN